MGPSSCLNLADTLLRGRWTPCALWRCPVVPLTSVLRADDLPAISSPHRPRRWRASHCWNAIVPRSGVSSLGETEEEESAPLMTACFMFRSLQLAYADARRRSADR